MSIDELVLLEQIKIGLPHVSEVDASLLSEVQDGEVIILKTISPEMLEIFAYLQKLKRQILQKQEAIRIRDDDIEKDVESQSKNDKITSSDISAKKKVVFKHRGDLSVLRSMRRALKELFYGSFRKQFPEYATADWYIRKSGGDFVLVAVPTWDPKTWEPCAEREVVSK
jgi:hypothetical protein